MDLIDISDRLDVRMRKTGNQEKKMKFFLLSSWVDGVLFTKKGKMGRAELG